MDCVKESLYFPSIAMNSLNIAKIEEDASARLEVASKTKELQSLLNRFYPGYVVELNKDENAPAEAKSSLNKDTFAQLSGIAQIQTVLKDQGSPMAIGNIFDQIQARGGGMSKNSMMSILSANKKKFSNPKRGHWAALE